MKFKLGSRFSFGARSVLAGLGLISVPMVGSALTYDEASSANTVEAYSSVILGGGSEEEMELALCSLQRLDPDAANATATELGAAPYEYTVDFVPCASTGSARLTII